MTNQQQPECPAEFAWMKPGVFADYREYQIVQIMEPPAIEQNEWRVRCQYTTDTFGYLPCANLEMYGGDSEFNHVCARLAEAEARVAMMTVVDGELSIALDRASKAEVRASADAAKLARVKALLDGVGPVVKLLKGLHTLAIDGKWVAKGGAVQEIKNTHGNHIASDISSFDASFIVEARNSLPAMLSAISEVREVLKGE